jgi:nucleoside-diphosphate-sugar epimerase
MEAWGDYKSFLRSNVTATEQLIRTAIKQGVKKFVYVSSAAVVADGKPLRDITEDYKPARRPLDHYTKTKAQAEEIVAKYQDFIQTIMLRPPLIWGENMPLMEDFREMIEKYGFPTIGEINHTLATCHVNNVSAAIIQSLQSDISGTFFITDGQKRPLRQFMKELANGYGLDTGSRTINRGLALFSANIMEFAWKILTLKGQPPLTKSIVFLMGTEFSIDDSKARKQLGYKNVISIEEGLKALREVK